MCFVQAVLLCIAMLPVSNQAISRVEREVALERLRTSRERFLQSIESLSESQWRFKPSPFRWSIAECAEHIAATEEQYLQTLTKLLESQPSEAAEPALKDSELSAIYTDRNLKRTAPASLQPKGRWPSRSLLLEHFNQTRAKVIAIGETTQAPLRSYRSRAAYQNLMDGYQWFLRFAGHCERHTAQIEEVKAHPNFPKK